MDIRKPKIIKRETLDDLERRRIELPPPARKALLDKRATLIKEVRKIERELQTV